MRVSRCGECYFDGTVILFALRYYDEIKNDPLHPYEINIIGTKMDDFAPVMQIYNFLLHSENGFVRLFALYHKYNFIF